MANRYKNFRDNTWLGKKMVKYWWEVVDTVKHPENFGAWLWAAAGDTLKMVNDAAYFMSPTLRAVDKTIKKRAPDYVSWKDKVDNVIDNTIKTIKKESDPSSLWYKAGYGAEVAAETIASWWGSLIKKWGSLVNKVRPTRLLANSKSKFIPKVLKDFGKRWNKVPEASTKAVKRIKQWGKWILKKWIQGVWIGWPLAVADSTLRDKVKTNDQLANELDNKSKSQTSNPTSPVTATDQIEATNNKVNVPDETKQKNQDVQESWWVSSPNVSGTSYNQWGMWATPSNSWGTSSGSTSTWWTTSSGTVTGWTTWGAATSWTSWGAAPDIWKITEVINQKYHDAVAQWYSMEQTDKLYYDLWRWVNQDLIAQWQTPIDVPAPKFSNGVYSSGTVDEQASTDDYKPPAYNEDYSKAIAQQSTISQPTNEQMFDNAMNNPNYIFNPKTQEYELSRKIVFGTDDVEAASSLLNSFQPTKVAGSWVGMSQDFGISMVDLNMFVGEMQSMSSRFPDGAKQLEEMSNTVAELVNSGNVAGAQDALAHLKDFAGAVAAEVYATMIKDYNGDFDILWVNPTYQLAKKIKDGGATVKRYLSKSYADIKAEASKINRQLGGTWYVPLSTKSQQIKSLMANNDMYKQMLETYASKNDIMYKQLVSDLYKPDVTTYEDKFLRWLRTDVYTPLQNTYNELKDEYGSTKAYSMLPWYKELWELVNINYRTVADDLLDSISAGTDNLSVTTTSNFGRDNSGFSLFSSRKSADNDAGYTQRIDSFQGIV